MDDVVYVLVETSAIGETVLGVFTDVRRAREAIPVKEVSLLHAYRVEIHALDARRSEPQPWVVQMTRAGELLDASVLVGCSCEDDHEACAEASYIEGERMQLLVWSATPGLAIRAAEAHRARLVEDGVWDGARSLSLAQIEA